MTGELMSWLWFYLSKEPEYGIYTVFSLVEAS